MAEPRLSIVTITYKDAKGLRETIESLKPLQHELTRELPWEHVVVDSSPDDNDTVFAGLPPEWPLVRVKVAPEGIYAAINTGLSRARGEFLWFLNGGDLLNSTTAVRQVFTTYESDATIDFVASTAEFRRDGRHLYMHRPYPWVLRSLIGMNRLCHQGIVYRRRVFDKVGQFSTELKLAADYEHHLRCVAAGVVIKCIPRNVLAIYDMSGRSNDYEQAFQEFRTVQRELSGRLPAFVNVGNALVHPLEYAKVATLKTVAASPLAEVLRPLWLAFKRKG